MKPLVLLDSSIYVFRAYFSIPASFQAPDGQVINAVYGYTQFLLDLLAHNPRFISAAFDESLISCYRNRIYPEYKVNRDLPDENLTFQLARCQEITRLLGIHNICLYDYEADDIIGSVQKKFGLPTTIVSRDKDLGQLLGDDDELWDFASDQRLGPSEVAVKFGVHPHQIADFLALAGDAVDNIPGAPGIGAKTAAALLGQFSSIDGIYEAIEQIPDMGLRGARKVQKILQAHEETIRMFQEITRIHTDIEIDVSLDDLRVTPLEPDALARFCDEMGFGERIRDRMGLGREAT